MCFEENVFDLRIFFEIFNVACGRKNKNKNTRSSLKKIISLLKKSKATTLYFYTVTLKKKHNKISSRESKIMMTEEESKPLLQPPPSSRARRSPAFFVLTTAALLVLSTIFAVHFSSSSLSSSDLGVGIHREEEAGKKFSTTNYVGKNHPHLEVEEEEATKLGEEDGANDVSTDANDDDDDDAKEQEEEEEEDKDAAPKPENHEEQEVVETEDDEKVEKLIAKENELSEEVKGEMTDWKGGVEEQHKEIVDAVQILTTIEDDDDVAKATGSVDDAVAKVHKAQALIKDAVAAPPKIEKESEEIDGITQEIEEEIDNTDSTPSSSSTVTPEEAEAKMDALREHISNKQAEITKACDDISAAKAAMLDGSLAKDKGLKQIITNAEIIGTSEASVYEEFHLVTKATESEPKGQTQAPSSPSDTDN